MVVHASIGGVDAKTVNAAYTSQTCPGPTCGYVSRDNRQGDKFHCRNSYWECNSHGDADHVAATNLLSRLDDREIGPLSTATLNEHGETFNVSPAGTNAMATLCVASRSCQGRKSSM